MIKAAGWEYDHAEGGHRYYIHLLRMGIVTIPWHRRQAVKIKTAKSILTQAGIKKPR
jgi:predicted RNA binding protein YcfA (HicA-like mRNA interferase family)